MHKKLISLIVSILCIISSVLFLSCPDEECISWIGNWTRIGLEGFTINSIAIVPLNPSTIFAGTDGSGVYKSEDGGASWFSSNSGITGIYITCLAAHPTVASIIYAGTLNKGVFKSYNSGNDWSPIMTGLTSNYIMNLTLDPKDPDTLYVCTSGDGVFKSVNGGDFWFAINTGLLGGYANSLVIDSSNTDTIYVNMAIDGIFKSINGGTNWTAINNGLSYTEINCLAIDPNNPNILFAAVGWVGEGVGVYRTTDGGATWSMSHPYGSLYVVVDPRDSSIVYADDSRTTDGGDIWLPPYDPIGIRVLAFDPVTTTNLYAGTGNGIYFSDNQTCRD